MRKIVNLLDPEPDRNTYRDIMNNWQCYSRDLPPNSAEIDCYTLSPMFRGTKWAAPSARPAAYNEQSAEMVEETMRELFKWQPKARNWLIAYWLYAPSERVLAGLVGMSRSAVNVRMKHAHDAFVKHWGLLHMSKSG